MRPQIDYETEPALAAVVRAGGPGLAGLAAAGALEGAIIGGFVGSVARARFDDDPALIIDVDSTHGAVLVVVRCGGLGADVARVRECLRTAGAVAFLDPTCLPELIGQY